MSDVRSIAETRRTDVEKANDADNVANLFCDIIEKEILARAGHVYVLVSMLLPRIDLQEAAGMGNPNNVRKVINVQITARLYENPRVSLINSDKVLDWGDDDVRLNQLVRADGFTLTELGCRLVLNNWADHIKKKMLDANFLPDNNNKAKVHNNSVKIEDNLKPVPAQSVETSEPEPVKEEEVDVDTEDTPGKEDEEDIVNDPFGSYQAPCELVSRPRTVSTSGPGQAVAAEETEDIDDDSLPNLETVPKTHQEQDSSLENKMSSVKIQESHENGVDKDFDLGGEGFIEDNYCGNEESKQHTELPSMMSMGPSSDNVGLVSGNFIEDSYLPSSPKSPENMKTVEFSFTSSSNVKIAGDFNSWVPQEMEKGSDNAWKFLIDLPQGQQYSYKYFVDGEWKLDEACAMTETESGIKNNIIQC